MNNSTQVALITGANKGIGLEIARQLGQAGYTVLVGARNLERGEAAAEALCGEGLDARFIPIDVTDAATIASAAATIEKEFGVLDVLVNNAGVALEAAGPSVADLNLLRQTFETNVFGVVAVTQALLPLVRKSAAGRIVNVSSGLGSLADMGDPASPFYEVNPLAYNASKTALNAFTVSLAKELRDTPIKVNSVCPGFTATDLNGNSGTQTIAEGAVAPVRLALQAEGRVSGGFFNKDGVVRW